MTARISFVVKSFFNYTSGNMFKIFLVIIFFSLPIAAQNSASPKPTPLSKPEIKTKIDFKDLPQTPPAKPRLTTDAQDMRLKGKVRIVTLRHFDGAGQRMYTEESHFNERGDLLRVLFYDVLGNLTYVNYFGYIEGKRVSLKIFPDKKDQVAPKAGYDTEYSYIYNDKGRLKEKRVMSGRSEAIFSYAYSGASIVVKYSNAWENYHSVRTQTLNEKGDVAEETYRQVLVDDSISNVEAYKYQYEKYDAQGNWTSATTTNTVTSPEGKTSTSKRSETREIIYY